MSNSNKRLCVSFSSTGAGLCRYHLSVWSDLNFLHISLWITLPTQSCLVLYSLCSNLLHSLIMWLMVSSLSPHSRHFLFCCELWLFFSFQRYPVVSDWTLSDIHTTSLLIFLYWSLIENICFQYFQVHVTFFLFSERFNFSWMGFLFFPLFTAYRFSFLPWHIFLC